MPLLAFDGEIKDRVTPKSGPGTPNPIALSATQCTENKELALWQRRKNVWLGLTAVKLAQGVGFVLHSWLGQVVAHSLLVAHSSTKGSRQFHTRPICIHKHSTVWPQTQSQANKYNFILRESTVKITALRINKAMHTWPIIDRFPEISKKNS